MSERTNTPLYGVAVSVAAFWVGVKLQKRTGLVVCNPLLVGVILTVGLLLALDIPYEHYDQGGSLINLFLSPATACLAVAIYSKVQLLKENWLPLLLICVITTVVTFAATAYSVRLVMRLLAGREAGCCRSYVCADEGRREGRKHLRLPDSDCLRSPHLRDATDRTLWSRRRFPVS